MSDKHQNKAKRPLKDGLVKLVNLIRDAWNKRVLTHQLKLAHDIDGLPLLSVLAVICGLLSAGIIILFRLFVDGSLASFLPNGDIELFEGLNALQRFMLCAGGGLLVGLFLQSLKQNSINVGVPHVIERLDYHQGYLPFKNAVVQFISASISLITGQSVGREGPSVHLGAASGSILGRWLKIPNNSVRTLVGCGVAAAIAAAFNTPLAAVIFAMEVVMMEYTIIGFTPVILAAVSATAFTRIVLGDYNPFTIPAFELQSIQELPIVAILGLIIGCLSAFFTQSTLLISTVFSKQAIWLKATAAGVIAGIIAIAFPQIMGTGYDTVNAVMLTELGLSFLVLLVFAKIIATSFAVGLGIPAGLIGPTLFIGACAGSVIGLVAQNTVLGDIANPGFYAILGMAAMMAATLQAPLAALIYLLELTANQAVIMPGMIAVIMALLVTRVVFKKSSIYRLLLLQKGRDYRNSPISQALRRIGVASVMERNIIQQENTITVELAKQLLQKEPRWILLPHDEQQHANILPATDLAHYLNDNEPDDDVDLMEIPAKRHDAANISVIATLQEAHEKMLSENCEVLIVTGAHGKAKSRIYGIVSREHIESSYRV